MGKFVVKYRKFILLLAVILIIPALIGMFSTKVNYDMLNYLPNSMETVIGQEKLMEEFHKGAFSMIITEGLSSDAEANLETELKKIGHVDTVLGLGTIENAGLPAEFLPDNIYNTFHKGN